MGVGAPALFTRCRQMCNAGKQEPDDLVPQPCVSTSDHQRGRERRFSFHEPRASWPAPTAGRRASPLPDRVQEREPGCRDSVGRRCSSERLQRPPGGRSVRVARSSGSSAAAQRLFRSRRDGCCFAPRPTARRSSRGCRVKTGRKVDHFPPVEKWVTIQAAPTCRSGACSFLVLLANTEPLAKVGSGQHLRLRARSPGCAVVPLLYPKGRVLLQSVGVRPWPQLCPSGDGAVMIEAGIDEK